MLASINRSRIVWMFISSLSICGAASSCASGLNSRHCDDAEWLDQIRDLQSIEGLLVQSPPSTEHRGSATRILATWLNNARVVAKYSDQPHSEFAAALVAFNDCADLGSSSAHFLLGAHSSSEGMGKADLRKAAKHFDDALSGGIALGHLGKAVVAYRLSNVGDAEQSVRELMKLDTGFSAELVGMLLKEGRVFPRSSVFAKPWLELAATRDNSAKAQRALARMYATGDGVPRSEVEAKKWRDLLAKNPEGNLDWDAGEQILYGTKPAVPEE